ncbi:LysR family transcriptional regulator [Sphingomonas sp. RRHST34]|uniref:LysR family transcriptional regulator n=1 Tax=Sphingomonas citri TaxID=2862499 RepID=A0ABS7BLN5_9SPHN|nr:LysR family transcriptional regulator [Sphingomonas citri]MBW6530500.1 LysR family transcriptional regulator [Sphingomonas citri]
MMKLDGLEALVAVAEAGSISAAARRLGLAKSVVSDRLAELERTVGARLVQRTTRALALTADGDALIVRARSILREVSDAQAEVVERRGSLAGPLRLAGPISFGALHLGPAIYRFLALHPEIQLTLDLDDRFVDAAGDGYDAVIRHGPITDERLIVRHLASSRRLLVASPAYLEQRGWPRTLAELDRISAILYTNRDADWRFPDASGTMIVRPSACLRVNNGLVMRDAALAGLGVTLLPTFFIHRDLADGSLVHVDVGVEAEGATIHVAYPANRSPSAKLAALVAWLRTEFGTPAYWDVDLS